MNATRNTLNGVKMNGILKNKWTWIVGAALVVGAFFALSFGNSNNNTTDAAGNDTAVAFIGELSTSTSSSGQVEAVQSANLSVNSAGVVTDIFVREGDSVTAGEPLLQVDAADLQIQVERAEQTVALQQASLEALLNGARTEDITAAEAAVASAQANLDNLLAGPDQYQIAESEANLRSKQASVASASASYNSTVESVTDAQIAQAEINVVNAQLAYDQTVEINSKWATGANHDAMIEAQEALEIARQALSELLDGPVQGSITNVAGGLSAANANLSGAQADHDTLLEGASAQQIANAEAGLAQAESNLAKLLDSATTEDVIIAEENLRQAEINLLNAEEALLDATVTAPFDGIVTTIGAAVGEYANGQVIEIVSNDLKVVLEVDEIDIGQIVMGQSAVLDLETWPDAEIPGEVTAIAPSSNTGTDLVAFDVTISLAETELPILVGMTANADLITASFSEILLVPNSAITADRTAGTYTVKVVVDSEDGQNIIESVPVTIGAKSENYTEVTGGLSAGDEVALGEIEAPITEIQIGPGG
ncbi:MAG: efflux RND transporter periplasmic adaptor subunit [Chloroflexota bacterium]